MFFCGNNIFSQLLCSWIGCLIGLNKLFTCFNSLMNLRFTQVVKITTEVAGALLCPCCSTSILFCHHLLQLCFISIEFGTSMCCSSHHCLPILLHFLQPANRKCRKLLHLLTNTLCGFGFSKVVKIQLTFIHHLVIVLPYWNSLLNRVSQFFHFLHSLSHFTNPMLGRITQNTIKHTNFLLYLQVVDFF